MKIPIDPDVVKMTEPQIEAIKPGLDINVLNVIGDWRCDDDEHNEYIDIILDLAQKAMKKKKKQSK